MSNPWFNDEQMGGHSDKPTPPPPSETKLKDAIDRLINAVRTYDESKSDREPRALIEGTFKLQDLIAARSSLESLFKELLLENAELRGEKAQLQEEIGRWSTNEDGYRAKLSALRSLQLTEEEKTFIWDGLLLHAPGWRIPEALSEKLRISSS